MDRKTGAQTFSDRAVAVAGWLRAHPDVEAGPSVRASMAFAELAAQWRELAGSDDLLPPALMALPHRLRVRPGVDADELVRLALLETAGEADNPADPGQHRARGGGQEDQMGFLVALQSGRHTPEAPDLPPVGRYFGDDVGFAHLLAAAGGGRACRLR